jgi:hypothetical protein
MFHSNQKSRHLQDFNLTAIYMQDLSDFIIHDYIYLYVYRTRGKSLTPWGRINSFSLSSV